MDINKYMTDRVINQIEWYDNSSIKCQKIYKILQIIEITLASLIPLLAAYSEKYTAISICVGLFGSIIAIIESITKLNKYHENWIEYRTTCELLRYHKNLFETRSYPYATSEETIENLFVKNIENIISSENNKWKSLNTEEHSADNINS